MLRTIFFDLDGTLATPSEPFAGVFTRSCAPLHAAPADLEQLLAAFERAVARPGPSSCLACLAAAGAICGLARPAPDRLASCAALLTAEWAAAQRLQPYAPAVLRALSARWPLGLITNGPSDMQRGVVEHLGLAPCFRWIVVSGDADVGVRKPDPVIFQHALDLAGCRPEEALYVGDSAASDIVGAKGAGMLACWLNASSALLTGGIPLPDVEIPALADLPSVLTSYAR